MSKEMDIIGGENPTLVNAIENMISRGYSKETIQRVTGAPYEIVDARVKRHERDNRPKRPTERDHNDG